MAGHDQPRTVIVYATIHTAPATATAQTPITALAATNNLVAVHN